MSSFHKHDLHILAQHWRSQENATNPVCHAASLTDSSGVNPGRSSHKPPNLQRNAISPHISHFPLPCRTWLLSPSIINRRVQLFRTRAGPITTTVIGVVVEMCLMTISPNKPRKSNSLLWGISTGAQVADLISDGCSSQLSHSSSLFMHVSGTNIYGIHCSNSRTGTQSFGHDSATCIFIHAVNVE